MNDHIGCAGCGTALTGRSQVRYCSRACSNAHTAPVAECAVAGDVCEIRLVCGSVALVDAADYPLVVGRRWRLHSRSTHGRYVMEATRTKRDGRGKRTGTNLFLHRLIAGTPPGLLTDHIDGDPLNNRRSNLRVVVDAQNAKNKRTRSRAKTSQYKGVHRYKDGRWAASVTVDYRRLHLGYFIAEDDAARAYNAAAREHHGEYAALNVIPHGE